MSAHSFHESRLVHDLSGFWQFAFLDDTYPVEILPEAIRTSERMVVPGAFDAMPKYVGKRGRAFYRHQIQVTPNRGTRLQFEAVSFWCRVWVDGVCVGEHDGGFTSFHFDLPKSDRAERLIEVLVDNRFDYERSPLHEPYFDFYQWGGLIRKVWWHELSPVFVDRVRVEVVDWRQGIIRVQVKWGGNPNSSTEVRLEINGQDPVQTVVDSEYTLRVENPKSWSPEHSHLYRLRVVMGEDDFIVRFGLRSVSVEAGKILLNDEPVRLLGFNRHESHPQFGPSLPDALLLADLQQLRDLGCNFIQGSHYPQDPRFLDLCDEVGFLVWEEAVGWQQRERQLTDPRFLKSHRQCIREMVEMSENHPSVILWGFLNEGASDSEYARPAFESAVQQLREMDSTRLITYGSMYVKSDLYFDLVDVISLNTYPGWYACEGEENPLAGVIPKLESHLKYLNSQGHGEKPVLISEIGVEALYGWHDAHGGFFTEEYQAEYLGMVCRFIRNHSRYSGVAIWHFSDARTYSGGYSLKRPRAFNNKGVLDEYRRPKAAYRVVRDSFLER